MPRSKGKRSESKEDDDSGNWIELLAQASEAAEYASPNGDFSTGCDDTDSSETASPPDSTIADARVGSPEVGSPEQTRGTLCAATGTFRESTPHHAATLRFEDLERIVQSFEDAQIGGRALPFPPRPAHVTSADVGYIYAELPGYSRRRAYRYEKCQTWKSSGGRIGSTNLDNGLTSTELRIFLRKYGKVMSHAGTDSHIALRFHKYVEIDPITQLERGPNIYFIPPSKQEQLQKKNAAAEQRVSSANASSDASLSPAVNYHGPISVGRKHRKTAPGPDHPLLTLSATTKGEKFVSFVQGGKERGHIMTSGQEGVAMVSSSGDFAEWHQQSDPSENLNEGDVVGFSDGKVSLCTADSHLFGVVSARPVVLGSAPKKEGLKGAVIAYCGRVPVRAFGPVKAGDVLMPSGKNDGLAVVNTKSLNNSSIGDCEQVSCGANPATAAVAVAVALVDNRGHGVVLVESVITPPALTKDVLLSLNGASKAQASRRLYTTGCLFTMLLLSTMLTVVCLRTSEMAKGTQPDASYQYNGPTLPLAWTSNDTATPDGMKNNADPYHGLPRGSIAVDPSKRYAIQKNLPADEWSELHDSTRTWQLIPAGSHTPEVPHHKPTSIELAIAAAKHKLANDKAQLSAMQHLATTSSPTGQQPHTPTRQPSHWIVGMPPHQRVARPTVAPTVRPTPSPPTRSPTRSPTRDWHSFTRTPTAHFVEDLLPFDTKNETKGAAGGGIVFVSDDKQQTKTCNDSGLVVSVYPELVNVCKHAFGVMSKQGDVASANRQGCNYQHVNMTGSIYCCDAFSNRCDESENGKSAVFKTLRDCTTRCAAHHTHATIWLLVASWKSWAVGRLDPLACFVIGRARTSVFPMLLCSPGDAAGARRDSTAR